LELLQIKPSSDAKITWNSTSHALIFNDVTLISTEDFFYIYPKEFNTLMDLLFHPANEVVVVVGASLMIQPRLENHPNNVLFSRISKGMMLH
jgi:hypothetical protein